MKKLFIILSLAILGCDDFGESTYYETCSTNISGIYGGSVVEYKQGIVGLIIDYQDGTFGRCTGFILNEDTVITSAHCMVDFRVKNGKVNISITHFDPCLSEKDRIFRGEAQFWIHPDYSDLGNWGNDLAVIKSPTPWVDTNTSNYLSIWSDSLSDVNYVTMYGVGYTNNRSKSTWTLKKGNRELFDFSESILETIAGKDRTCHGDSGGPIFNTNSGDNLVIGLVSGSKTTNSSEDDNCAAWGMLQYSVRINTEKVDWIERVTGATCTYSISEHGHGQRTCRY